MSSSCRLSRTVAAAGFGGVVFVGLVAQPASADRLMLLSGETIEVTKLSVSDTSVSFSHPVLGDMTLARDQIREIEENHAPGRFEQQASLGALQDEDAAAEDRAPEWSGSFTGALTGTSGNSESVGLVALAETSRETNHMITKVGAGYFLSTSDGDRSENRLTITGRNDWLFPDSPWFVFADATFDYDEFQSWEYRISGHVGPGYVLVDNERYKAKALAGIGFVKEFNSPNDDIRGEALIGIEGEWTISEKQSLAYDATIYPDLNDGGEFRTIENLMWKLELDEETNMSLAAGLQHEYQSQTGPGQDKNDFRIFIGLNFSF